MKRAFAVGAVAAIMFAGAAGAASLHLQLTGDGSNHDPDGSGYGVGSVRGGLFQLTITSTSGLAAHQLGGDIVVGKSFLSFCVEVTEHVSSPANYSFNVNTASVHGGASPFNPNPLAEQTAFLYSKFREGTVGELVSGGFTQSNDADVNALQDAIWYFQNQLGVVDVEDNDFVSLSAKAQEFVTAANNARGVTWFGIGNVRILNLGANGNNQDQLALVPLPHGAGLAMAGLLAAGLRRRRSV